ncbi:MULTISPECIES: DUF6415 family natural product biosynthesis protein [unclassified Streptomyces]|uniref:DUF6415 family natural product biosynthesis protein n=1 Tax=unclassified Streptomyces TaxID=2593676 RepID=UPI00131A25DB|nr:MULTISPECIES: DUF6415 family natural product biosynthesis protein [unclassified Streptomyces]MYT30917.1 hypothetical protein [Streptomyces sp. SID8354]
MDTSNDSAAILAEHLEANGVAVVWADSAAVSVSHPLNSAVHEDVTAVNGRYVTAYGYEVGQYGDEQETAHRVAYLVNAGSRGESLPVDVELISATIQRALRLGSGRPDPDALTELEEELRGHVALLLPEVRESARSLWPNSIEAHRLHARLDGIWRQTQRSLGRGVLSAQIRVHQLARDCQYLLAWHTAGSRR